MSPSAAAGPVRFGVLGAARIAPAALVKPARAEPGAVVVAIAARDPARAQRFAARHGIPRVQPSYEALIADPEVEAVYNPLPNSLHAHWSIRALEAGKHVLCEKPIAANAQEAEAMAQAAAAAGKVLMEAFHYRYHALAERLKSILASGELGAVRRVEAHLHIPLLRPGDIRFRPELAGGATMDVGCYAVHIVRLLAGSEPEVVTAQARWTRSGVDRCMTAELRFPNGPTGRISCSLLSWKLAGAGARVEGTKGVMSVLNPFLPQLFHRLRVRTPAGSRVEQVYGAPTYLAQLRAFVAAVRSGAPVPTGPADAIANMRVIDAIYAAAGRQREVA